MTDRYRRLAPLAGIAMVAFFSSLFVIDGTPDSNWSGQRVLAYYQHHHTSAYVLAVCLAGAALSGILYYASIADHVRRAGSRLLSTTAVVGAAIFGIGILLGVGTIVASNDDPKHMPATVAQTLNYLNADLFWPVMFCGLGTALLSIGVATLRTKALPQWLGIVTTVVGVGALTPVGWFAFMLSWALAIVTGIYAYQRFDRPRSVTIPEVPAARTAAETTQASNGRTTAKA